MWLAVLQYWDGQWAINWPCFGKVFTLNFMTRLFSPYLFLPFAFVVSVKRQCHSCLVNMQSASQVFASHQSQNLGHWRLLGSPIDPNPRRLRLSVTGAGQYARFNCVELLLNPRKAPSCTHRWSVWTMYEYKMVTGEGFIERNLREKQDWNRRSTIYIIQRKLVKKLIQ